MRSARCVAGSDEPSSIGLCIAVVRATGDGEPIIGLGTLSRLTFSALRRATLSLAYSSTCFTRGFIFMNATSNSYSV
jgi:hypothetical protein